MGVERSCLEQPLEVDKNFTQISSPVGWFISQITLVRFSSRWLDHVPTGSIHVPIQENHNKTSKCIGTYQAA